MNAYNILIFVLPVSPSIPGDAQFMLKSLLWSRSRRLPTPATEVLDLLRTRFDGPHGRVSKMLFDRQTLRDVSLFPRHASYNTLYYTVYTVDFTSRTFGFRSVPTLAQPSRKTTARALAVVFAER